MVDDVKVVLFLTASESALPFGFITATRKKITVR